MTVRQTAVPVGSPDRRSPQHWPPRQAASFSELRRWPCR
jgi:hypothetical protein